MSGFINYNGEIFDGEKTIIHASDHSYRFGDGLFETMKVKNGNILLVEYHLQRLFAGSKILKFDIPSIFTEQKIRKEITGICEKNNCNDFARIRLSVSRGNGGLYDCDDEFSYLIECWPLEKNISFLNENGLVIDIFPGARKSIDAFSNLKSANYLPYVMAVIWAKENKLNDALILNQHDRICDATIANIFWVKNQYIFTPPLSEGCVAGVMRKRILDLGLNIQEKNLTERDLINGDEVFLTNVITGVRWVKQFRDKVYDNRIAEKIFTQIQTISS
ncbi:MAG TPA: aminotransferase class IV [Chitinophagaceae bacterium]|nr:aminotransferase class IV [Chitinophagaceae bacterium]